MSDFEQASRLKLRFNTQKGNLSTEDLWDLPLLGKFVCLDDIAKAVYAQVKSHAKKSFVEKRSKHDTVLDLKLDILKHIIKVKLAAIEANEKAAENKAKYQQVLSIISEKENESLKDKSMDELKAMASELQ